MNQGAEPTGRREAPAPGGGLSALRETPEFRGPIEPLEDHDHSNDHLASLYDTRDEQFDAVVPFIREGLERGERCLYVADQNSREAVLAAMRDRGADVDADGLPRVWGDESQLHQLFQNLLRNAIEYSGDEPPRVRISAEREGGRWVISVSDDGVGIDPDDADRLFEMFQRLHGREEHEGAGIGLALCERIVERHGGDIRVDSTPGEGSTFSRTTGPTRRSSNRSRAARSLTRPSTPRRRLSARGEPRTWLVYYRRYGERQRRPKRRST